MLQTGTFDERFDDVADHQYHYCDESSMRRCQKWKIKIKNKLKNYNF